MTRLLLHLQFCSVNKGVMQWTLIYRDMDEEVELLSGFSQLSALNLIFFFFFFFFLKWGNIFPVFFTAAVSHSLNCPHRWNRWSVGAHEKHYIMVVNWSVLLMLCLDISLKYCKGFMPMKRKKKRFFKKTVIGNNVCPLSHSIIKDLYLLF